MFKNEINLLYSRIWTFMFHGSYRYIEILGQERYRCLSRTYLKGCQACVIVCDVTRPDTIENVATWKRDVDIKCGDIPTLLLANKEDLPHKMTHEELKKIAEALKFTKAYFTTAKKFILLEKQIYGFAEKVNFEKK